MQLNSTFLKVPHYNGAIASAYDKFLMVAAFALVSGLFFLSDDHRYGLVFLREGVIVLSVLAVGYVLVLKKEELDTVDWYLLVMVLLLFLIPPVFAYLSYQQPLQYGLLEERRTLLYFVYFLIMLTIGGRKAYGEADLESVLKYLFYLGLAWSAANAFELIPRNSGFAFSVHSEQFAEDFVATDERFDTRFLEAGFLITFYPYYLIARGQFLKAVLPIVLLAAYMLFINQTRGLGLAIVLTLLWITILRQRLSNFNVGVMLLVPAVAILGYLSYFLYAYTFNEPVFFYDYHRNRELHVMLGEALNHFLLPHGALSLQFNEGFRSVYGINMYVSDIGLGGLLFKFGIFFFPLVFMMIMIVHRLAEKYRNHFSIILMAMLLADFMIIPFGDFLGRGAEEFALLIVLIRLQGVDHGYKYIACVRRGRSS
ncbi:hypothetical protein SAMN05660964_01063 [Thiothrix caldifontis]|uniref:O-antigen ligase like membrane protein n=1 Tax=Thiothrix caldifontis TaxID=525918 RepID=A0A1H3Z5A3_9GAMM|nr:hypothetical protein [Thiothrix caldifontis]SEA18949.1 hypothetical protein SAMN05660964_01063 [Thiothrix caldifontis]